MLGVCDANYLFTAIDVGAYGRRSDGGIFRDCNMGQWFNAKRMNLPEPEPLCAGGFPAPYCLVGDEAFQMTDYMLRPYPGRGGLNDERRIFNYRLSRSRRTIENTFGILVSRWRILRKPIEATVNNTIAIVQAIVCLHNWLQKQDENNEYLVPRLVDEDSDDGTILGSWRDVIDGCALQDRHVRGTNNSSRAAF